MSNTSTTTTGHDTIRKWTEERDGEPSAASATSSADDAGIIRIDFPGYSREDSLEEISWDDWIAAFEENNLAFVYQDATADGERSNFNKLVSRDS